MKFTAAVLTFGCLIGAASAQQPSIFVDFGSAGSGFGVPSPTYAAAAPTGGEWNALDSDLIMGQPIYTTPPLLDINGAATPATLTYDGLGMVPANVQFNEPNTMGDDEALMDDATFVSGSNEIRLDGLPPGDYDVYTYAMAPDSSAFFTDVDVTNSASGLQSVGGDFSGGFALGVTHSLHTTSVIAGQPLVILVEVGTSFDTINGVQVLPSGGGSGLGTNYCGPANQSSSGLPARMLATGSRVAAANDLTVSCVDMPALVFGFFIVSNQQGFVMNPGGSAGNLCLSGAIGRYIGAGQIQNSGTMGTIDLTLDLTAIPQPLGFVSIQGGETWNWQTWFRDSSMGAPTSNFSDGLQIDFL